MQHTQYSSQNGHRLGWFALLGLASLAQAGTLTDDFTTTKGTLVGNAKVDGGILKLVDLAEVGVDGVLPGPGLQGSYIYGDLDAGKRIGGMNVKFKARVGGGTERPAQGYSMVFAGDIPNDAPFREGGGATSGLTIAFDTTDNQAGVSSNAEGNDPGEAPGIIVKLGGNKVSAKLFNGIRSGAAFVEVEVNLDPDGTLDVTYGGTKVYDNFPIGYTALSGQLAFGAGTEERTSATRDNHWIDDLRVTTMPVAGAYVAARAPGAQNARPDSVISLDLNGLASQTVTMKVNGADVVPVIKKTGDVTNLTYDPPGLLATGSKHSVVLTYDTNKTFAYDFTVMKFPTISASDSIARDQVDTATSGFQVRTVQAGSSVADIRSAENALQGLMGKNLADLKTAKADGTFEAELINLDKDGVGIGQIEGDKNIPGIPGINADGVESSDNFALEAITYLDLTAGLYTFGVTSDDGFKVTVGGDPRSVSSTQVGVFAGTRGTLETQFTFAVAADGLYPVRLVFFNNGGGANVELYSVESSGVPILLNDRANAKALKGYRARKAGTKAPPYIGQATPAPSQVNVDLRPNIEILVFEGETTVATGSVALKINNAPVVATTTKTGSQVKVSYKPVANLPANGDQVFELTFNDSAGTKVAGAWTFRTGTLSGADCGPTEVANPVTGYWTFDDGSLKAATGKDLKLRDDKEASHYVYGTTGAGKLAGVPNIAGKAAKVLGIPFTDDAEKEKRLGLLVETGLKANGGGTLTNQWTMIVDLLWQDSDGSRGFGTILRTHDLDQSLDGDLFWRKSDGGYGKGCCSLYDGVSPDKNQKDNEWARVVITADFATEPRFFGKYINGNLHRSDVQGDANKIDGRFSLPSTILMFNDGDDNEQASVYVSSLQFREGKMSEDDIKALGGPSADGIPAPASTPAPTSSVTGYWNFDNGDLKASVGKDLTLRDAKEASHYVYGTTGAGTLAGVPNIAGKAAKVVGIPFTDDVEKEKRLGFMVQHGMPANGGGTLTNQWTMIVDLLWQDSDGNKGFGTILRTHDLDQSLDGDLFWRKSDGGYGKGCCSLYDGVSPDKNQKDNEWARLVITADFTTEPRFFGKYINGNLHRSDVQGDANKIDGRFSLPSTILMFNDGDDNEQASVYVSALQFRVGKMSEDEIKALGGPSADGIPLPASSGGTATSSLTGYWDFDNGDLKAAHGTDLKLRDDKEASHYVYGTTSAGKLAGVPNIGATPAKVLGIPFTDDAEKEKRLGLLLKHGVPANGGGTLSNQWTMIVDLLWQDSDGNKGFGTILRTHDLDQSLDGDLFWRKSDGGYGKGCCSLYDGVSPDKNQKDNEWARLVITTDMTTEPRFFGKYINGNLHRSDVQGDANKIDGRFSLPAEILMFNDGDDNEQASVYINAIQFRNGKMSEDEIKALGGPSAAGIPLPASTGAVDCQPGTPLTTLPKLTVGRSGSNLSLNWDSAAGFILESSADLRAWAPVQGTVGTAFTGGIQQKTFFYRLRKP